MKRLVSLPLRASLPLVLLSCAAAAGLISWKLDTRMLRGEIEAQFLDEARLRVTGLQATLEYFIRKGDAGGVMLEVSGLATRDDVIAAFVMDREGRVLAATSWAMIGHPAEATGLVLPEELRSRHSENIAQVRASMRGNMVLSQDRRVAVAYYPLLVNPDDHALRSRRDGLVVMVLDTQISKARAFRASGRQALDNALVFGGLAACAWVFIHLSLTRRVNRLVATTRQLASGDLTARTGIMGGDELAQVAIAFDLMADRIAEDLLGRKRGEEELRKSENRFRNVFSLQFQFMAILSPEGRVIEVNDLALRAGGIRREEAVGQLFWETGWWRKLPGVRASWPGLLEAAARSGEAMLSECQYNNATDEVRDADLAITAAKRGGGEIECFIIQGSDITERKHAEAELEKTHRELQNSSRRAGMAEVATNVLHNVGNVLNSVNISTDVIAERVKKSRISSLARVVALLREHEQDLGAFIAHDARGKHLPAHLAQLSAHLIAEQEAIIGELDSLRGNIEHIKSIVAMQQNYATFGGVKEEVDVVQLVEDSLRLNENGFSRHGVEVVREFEKVPALNVEKHKVVQILVNLLRNAKHACQDADRTDKRMTVRVANGDGWIKIAVIDNGIGIPAENLTRIFNHGFTTRPDGHGFGLHSSALAAKEMGGSLAVQSGGHGQGATCILELPCAPSENLNP